MEYFIRYGKGYTHIRNGENAETEYYYGEDKLIYKIVDANGGITRHQYNSFQELEVTVNPEGYTRKTSYNEFGLPVRITDENGEDTFLDYDATATSSRSTLRVEKGFHGTMTDRIGSSAVPHRAERQ